MPAPDSPCLVINARSGYVRETRGWILGMILRDFEVWMDNGHPDGAFRRQLNRMRDQRWEEARNGASREHPGASESIPHPSKAGLCVSVFDAAQAWPGYPGYDPLYYMGIGMAVLQLGIAAIPLGIWGDWGVLLVNTSMIILSLEQLVFLSGNRRSGLVGTIPTNPSFSLVATGLNTLSLSLAQVRGLTWKTSLAGLWIWTYLGRQR